MNIGIVGFGVVGRCIARDVGDNCFIYDKFIPEYSQTKAYINDCDAVFVSVGTPEKDDGMADMSAIDDVYSWLRVPISILRSTIPPGTTDKLNKITPTVFVPEFIGEGVNPPYNAMKQPPFLILGGGDKESHDAIQVLRHFYNSECEIICMDALSAEIAKYAENYFLALKVTWANEMYDICQELGANYDLMMTGVSHDYRIGRSHTHVYEDKRGFDGRCLPKDTNALLSALGASRVPLLDAVVSINNKRQQNERS